MTSARLCIAVVDDEASVRTALRRLLRLAEYEVTVFGCGDEFLASLAAQHPVGGVKFVLFNSVVFITASDDAALDRKAQQAGGVKLLRKPFSNDELLDAVGAALSRASGDSS